MSLPYVESQRGGARAGGDEVVDRALEGAGYEVLRRGSALTRLEHDDRAGRPSRHGGARRRRSRLGRGEGRSLNFLLNPLMHGGPRRRWPSWRALPRAYRRETTRVSVAAAARILLLKDMDAPFSDHSVPCARMLFLVSRQAGIAPACTPQPDEGTLVGREERPT